VIFRNVGAIGATRLAERCSIILLTPTRWSVLTLVAGGRLRMVGERR